MFDLEKAIAEWRRQMLAAGLKTPATLDELENHLREDIRVLSSAGETDVQAFQLAVSRLGGAGPLRAEFNKMMRPACWPVTIGFWLYAGAMISMAVFVAAHSMSTLLLARASTLGLLANYLLIYAHIVIFTAGYCAAFFAGFFGITYVCYQFFHALSPPRRQSLCRAVLVFSHLAAGLTIVGSLLGMIWTRQHIGGYLGGGAREMAAFSGSIWIMFLLAMQRLGRVSEHATMLMCISGNVVVGLAWFVPFILVDGAGFYWPVGVFLILNLVFLLIGLAAAPEKVES